MTRQNLTFWGIIALLTIVCAFAFPYPGVAMWVGFGLAAYSAIANDSIQTIGTFIASNSHRKWWHLWLYMGGIFVATVTYSWLMRNGDVSSGRLASKGFDTAPESFSFLMLLAPVVLLVLTRLRMPVSTTFLLLNVFATDAKAMTSVVEKSLKGYFIAFAAAIVVWYIVSRFVTHYFRGKKPASWWLVAQWITSGALWSVWISQDAANIAVFLPRQLELTEFLVFAGVIFGGLALLFYLKGDKIQAIVNEKAGIQDIRAATLVDFVYAIILFFFKVVSPTPMSTTWVFIGLLAGRELAISFAKKNLHRRKVTTRRALGMMGKDAGKAIIGLLVSIALSIAVNPVIREAFANFFK